MEFCGVILIMFGDHDVSLVYRRLVFQLIMFTHCTV